MNPPPMRVGFARYALCLGVVCFALTSCGGSSTTSSGPLLAAPKIATPAPIAGDDWLTYAHDYLRSGYQRQSTGISRSNVSTLKLRWETQLKVNLYTSPLVYQGNVIVTSLEGTVYDLSVATGKLLWSKYVGGEIRATPTIDGNYVFVGNRLTNASGGPAPSGVFALSLLDGSLVWSTLVNGITHGSPIVANGVVYFPTSGGDPGSCINGGITALSEASGTELWRWAVDPDAGGGGSVWGDPAYTGSAIIAPTGNTCVTPQVTANGAVSLQLNGSSLNWEYASMTDASIDDDTGSSVLLLGNDAIFMNKNGSLYAVSTATGQKEWATPLGAGDQSGGFAGPTSDGSVIMAGAGNIPSSAAARPRKIVEAAARYPITYAQAGYVSYLCALDTNGDILWKRQMVSALTGYAAAMTAGIAFSSLDDEIYALNTTTGQVLWSYTSSTDYDFAASPAVVPSGVYDADLYGNVYAFSLP